MMIVPPPETANIPDVTPEQRAENDRRFAREDSIRKAYMATFVQPDGTEKGRLLALSAGNHRVIAKFLEDPLPFFEAQAIMSPIPAVRKVRPLASVYFDRAG